VLYSIFSCIGYLVFLQQKDIKGFVKTPWKEESV